MNSLSGKDKPKRRFTLFDGFVVSVVLHGLLVLVWFAPGMLFSGGMTQAQSERQTLNMDIFGMVSDRQVMAIVEIEEIPPPPDLEPEPEPTSEPEYEPEPPPEAVKQSEPPPEVKKPSPQVKPQAAQTGQAAETIAAANDKTIMQSYLVGVSRSIQQSLVYPEEAKANGWIGEPTISFTIMTDGSLKPGSLRVVKSCGHPLLDQQAVEAVRKRAPFSPPPREITMTIGISFKAK